MAYTEAEIKEFQAKDKRIVCQNALTHATRIVCELNLSKDQNETSIVNKVTEIASVLVDWVYVKANGVTNKDNSSTITNNADEGKMDTLPVPTVSQKEILERLSNSLEISLADIQQKSLDLLEHYPNNETEGKVVYTAFK